MSSPSNPRPKKRVRIEECANDVTQFNSENPVTASGVEMIDYTLLDAVERQKQMQVRLAGQQLAPERTGRLSNNQQAFSVFQIPVVIDSRLLTVKELQAELRVRGLRTDGTRDRLVRRLDKYLKEKEPSRIRE